MVKRDLKFWATFIGLKLLEIGGLIGVYLLGRWEVDYLNIIPVKQFQTILGYGFLYYFFGFISTVIIFIIGYSLFLWIIQNIKWTEKVLE